MTFAEWFTFKNFHTWFFSLSHEDQVGAVIPPLVFIIFACVISFNVIKDLAKYIRSMKPVDDPKLLSRVAQLEERVAELERSTEHIRQIQVEELPS